MKITSFQLTLQQAVDKDGYGDNFYISIDDKGLVSISRPYKSIPVEEQLAIEEAIVDVIRLHIKLVNKIDAVNKDLQLEEYAPIVSSEETVSESTEVSAVPQSSRLGDEEVSTGADGDIDKPVSEVVTDEDIFGE